MADKQPRNNNRTKDSKKTNSAQKQNNKEGSKLNISSSNGTPTSYVRNKTNTKDKKTRSGRVYSKIRNPELLATLTSSYREHVARRMIETAEVAQLVSDELRKGNAIMEIAAAKFQDIKGFVRKDTQNFKFKDNSSEKAQIIRAGETLKSTPSERLHLTLINL